MEFYVVRMNGKYLSLPTMEQELSFEDYLEKKKIDPDAFRNAESELYEELKKLFNQIHPDSFTAQKLFLINPIRRKYQFKDDAQNTDSKQKKIIKPKYKR